MKLIKFLILPFLSVFIFAQTTTDKKLITAGNYIMFPSIQTMG